MIADSKIMLGDCRTELDSLRGESVQSCITSPPYWGLRNYGTGDNQLGLEPTPEKYTQNMVEVFRSVKRVLKPSGTLWLNIGDTYCGTGHKGDGKDPKNKQGRNWDGHVAINNKIEGLKPKDLVGIPWRLAFALQADGWYLRQDIIWNKPNAMPEPVKDRCTKSYEHIFLLSKSQKYYYDYEAIADNTAEGSRNKRDVWSVNTQPYKDAHFATFPEKLIEPCILAGSKAGDTVLDPFTGSGTTGKVSVENNRNFVGVEINPDYKTLAENRINSAQPPLFFTTQTTNTITA